VAERVSLVNRIGAVLATLGVRDYNPLRRDRRERLDAIRTALGDPLPPHARARILRMLDRLQLVCAQIAELERERDAVLAKEAPGKAEEMIQQLAGLRCRAPPFWSGRRSCANSPMARRLVPTPG
jgi:transposase